MLRLFPPDQFQIQHCKGVQDRNQPKADLSWLWSCTGVWTVRLCREVDAVLGIVERTLESRAEYASLVKAGKKKRKYVPKDQRETWTPEPWRIERERELLTLQHARWRSRGKVALVPDYHTEPSLSPEAISFQQMLDSLPEEAIAIG